MNYINRRSGRNNTALMVILAIVTGVMIALAFIFYFMMDEQKIFPFKYLPFYIIAFAGITALSMLAIKKKWASIVMLIVTSLVSGALVYGINFSDQVGKLINKVSTEETVNISTMQVAVLKESSIQSIDDLAGERLAFASTTDTQQLEKFKSDIDSKVVGVSYNQESGMTGLANSLLDGKVSAIIMNSEYPDIISEIDGYKDFKDKIRIIYSVDVETIVKKEPEKVSDVDVFTLYLSGIDTFGDVMKTSRSDVNVLAVVNLKTKHILLVNTPRDYYVPLPNSDGVQDKLTHAAIYGVENSMGTLEMLYDTKVNYYLRMNFSGFEKIIDTLGGIDVKSDYEFTSTLNPEYSYEEGMNHLNGEAALFFARERHAFIEGDNQRGKDHMAIIEAVVKKLTSSPEFLTNYQNLFATLADSFQTSMPEDLIKKMINMEISGSDEWKIDSYAVEGEGEKRTTFSEPYSYLYVAMPDLYTVQNAKDMIEQVKNEEVCTEPTTTAGHENSYYDNYKVYYNDYNDYEDDEDDDY